MTDLFNFQCLSRSLLLAVGLLASVGLTGCQVETGGQSLPSAYYMNDDVQYFPPGREFKLQNEADAMKAYSQDQSQATKR
jgi:hypothetical protein